MQSIISDARNTLRGAQNALAQDAAMGKHEGKAGVVADGANIAKVVGEALKLCHQSAQPNRARRNFDAACRFDGAREGIGIGDRAVAGCPPSEASGLLDGGAAHERFDPLVGVAQTLFEPDHGFAVRGKAEMTRFDDSGMHGTDRDLVQAFAFRGTEMHRARGSPCGTGVCERVAHAPSAMIEPGTRVGQTLRLEPNEITDRAFETDGRRMDATDGGKTPIGTRQGRDGNLPSWLSSRMAM